MHLTLGAPLLATQPFRFLSALQAGPPTRRCCRGPTGLEGNWGSDSGQGRNICPLGHPSPIGYVSFL